MIYMVICMHVFWYNLMAFKCLHDGEAPWHGIADVHDETRIWDLSGTALAALSSAYLWLDKCNPHSFIHSFIHVGCKALLLLLLT